ncbi:hypothetical protein [Duncaniella muris]|jgi:hypothetical protein|uniref:hypothetical protein n=1 Tax=Duncaniella muris TaxID=2094150 RepID=UPI0025A5B120|nr:hypothetical protein [Duncaniella muris]
MKRKVINDQVKIKGFLIQEFNKGFFGENGEGRKMLKKMGLPIDTIPFSTVMFLQSKRIFWTDHQGNRATISFKMKPYQLECFGTYLGKRKSLRIFREWNNYEDPDMIARLESETIGELCMKCIYENLT